MRILLRNFKPLLSRTGSDWQARQDMAPAAAIAKCKGRWPIAFAEISV